MELSVISFNIRCCNDPNGNSIAQRAPRLAAVTAPCNADIIGLQEFRPAWEPYIERYYSDTYDIFFKYRNQTTDIEASPILWRRDTFTCLKTGYFWLSDTPEVESRGWDEKYNCYRMCTYAIFRHKLSGTSFTVMNTHFGFGDRCHVSRAELIYRYSRQISEFPTFIIGDFNMVPESVGYRAMTTHFTDVNARTAKDPRSTFHGYEPARPRNAHIDYCFIGENIIPISQRILDETIDGKFPSDHYGLHMVLNI